jgi:hypothetical protein
MNGQESEAGRWQTEDGSIKYRVWERRRLQFAAGRLQTADKEEYPGSSRKGN